jgi:hypothetical protein
MTDIGHGFMTELKPNVRATGNDDKQKQKPPEGGFFIGASFPAIVSGKSAFPDVLSHFRMQQ